MTAKEQPNKVFIHYVWEYICHNFLVTVGNPVLPLDISPSDLPLAWPLP